MDKLTIEDLRAFERVLLSNSGLIKPEAVLEMTQQLINTMRENEQLRKELHSARTRLVAYGENYSHKEPDA